MAIIKCKMCGGDIELSEDKTIGTCDSCGSQMTLPKIDDEQRAAAFNRGNHFRRIGEFDKALAVYERIVQENDSDAEAHWCCALCRFGIEYVEDPTTYEWLPTCHRASFDSFLEDVDYLAAVEHSDGVTRRQYQKEAERIAEIQRNILATSQNEQPFDVFICYKESDENGERTRDSAIAQDIYYQLTEQGFRVFFARITLEDKVGSQYEPYIFAALNSAKVMIVVGTKPEYMNAVWVKNEWSRFMALMKRDRSKLLLPCYRDMDPYDLPEQLSVLQAYDMSKIGFIQDLIRGVSKVLGKDKKPETTRETVVVQSGSGSNNDALLKRGQIALEDGEWDKADGYFDRVLDSNAERAEAYVGKFLAVKKCSTMDAYTKQVLSSMNRIASVEGVACQQDEERIKNAITQYSIPGYLEERQIRGLYEFSRNYWSNTAKMVEYGNRVKQELDADKLMSRAMQYADGEYKREVVGARTRLVQAIKELVEQHQKRDEEKIADIKVRYAGHLSEADAKVIAMHEEMLAKKAADAKEEQERKQAEERRRQEEEKQRKEEQQRRAEEAAKKQEEDYQAACRLQNEIKTPSQASDAANAFSKIGAYKDSEARARGCREKAEKLVSEQKKRKTVITIVAFVVAAIALAVLVLVTSVIIPSKHYKAAEAALNEKDYEVARAEFAEAGAYADAADRILDTYYQEAEQALLSDDIFKAAITFNKIGNYRDAKQRSYELWGQITQRETISAGNGFTVGSRVNGSVSQTGFAYYIYDWSDIIAVSAGYGHILGLKSDGTVVCAGRDSNGRYSVSDWNNIIAVSTGCDHNVGLKADGTVVTSGYNNHGERNVSDWSNIIAISAGYTHTVGLKADGTVVATGNNDDRQCNVSDWRDIIAVSAGYNHTVGLKADGTVVAVGNNTGHQCNVSGWSDIVAVSAGKFLTVGLKADGTVVAVGYNSFGECDVSYWSDIVAVSAGYNHTVGLKADGTVVAVGDDGAYNVYWSNIRVP